MSFRIYYQNGEYGYYCCDSRSMTNNYGDEYEYLEAETIEKLNEKIQNFIVTNAREAARSAAKRVDKEEKYYHEEHYIVQFTSPILEVHGEEIQDNLTTQYNSLYDNYFKEEVEIHLQAKAEEKAQEEREKQTLKNQRESDPDYATYLQMKQKFET